MDDFTKKIEDEENELNNLSSIDYNEVSDSIDKNNSYFEKTDDSQMKILTNFYKMEINELFALLSPEFAKLRSTRGKKSKLCNIDKLFLLLIFLKSYDNYNRIRILFALRPATVQLYLSQMIGLFSVKLYSRYVLKFPDNNSLIPLENFPKVKLIIDCSVQEIPRFSGSFNDNKIFFSGKHGIYCVKKEFVHLIDGTVVDVSENFPRSYHDFNIFLKRINLYKKLLKRNDGGEEMYFEIMADKGYEGIQKHFPAQIPYKGKNLITEQIRHNRKLASCRIIVERFYGRMKYLFKATRNKVKHDIKFHNCVHNLCVALTNFHIKIHPLVKNDEKINYRLSKKTGSQTNNHSSANNSSFSLPPSNN